MKIIVVINGKGGVGKDTFVDYMGYFFKCESINPIHISSITKIREIATGFGYSGKPDSQKDRQLLSDLKKLYISYNPLGLTNDIIKVVNSNVGQSIVFVDIREVEEIEKLKILSCEENIKVLTILVERELPSEVYTNSSDLNVDQYVYDYVIDNNGFRYQLLEAARQTASLIIKQFNI